MKRGFTLVELLVAMAIVSLLSTFVVFKYVENDQVKHLKNQAELIIDGLEKTQNMALTGQTTSDRTPLAYRFQLAECTTDCSYQIVAVFAADGQDEEVVENKNFGQALITTNTGQPLLATFNLPRGRLSLNDNQADSAWAQIANEDSFFCVKVIAVSGRLDLLSGECTNL